MVIVCLYLDDMMIRSKNIANINTINHTLASKCDMIDLGVVNVISGIKIHKTPHNIEFSQSHYI